MKIFALLAASLLGCTNLLGGGDPVEELVRAHFPEKLLTDPIEERRGMQFEFLDLDLDGSARDVVVLYSDDGGAVLCSFLGIDAAPQPVCAEALFDGTHAGLERIDLEKDGRPEFAVTLLSAGNAAPYVWLYRWQEGWQEISPVKMPFKAPQFVDLDGDGDLDVIDGLRYEEDTQAAYFWETGEFKRGNADIVESMLARRGTGRPTTVRESFSLEGNERVYRLRLVIDDKVSSAAVSVNGTNVVAPHEFRPGVRVVVSEPVDLPDPSEVVIELQGKPGGKLLLLIESPRL